MKSSKKSLCTQVDSLRPYKSRSQRPCDFCRRRKTCCIIEKSIPCTSCIQFNKGECTFKEGPVKRVNRKTSSAPTPIKKKPVRKQVSSRQLKSFTSTQSSPFAQQPELADYASASSSASPYSYRYIADQPDVQPSPHFPLDHQFDYASQPLPQQPHQHQPQPQPVSNFQQVPLLQFPHPHDRIKVERQESSSSIDTSTSLFDDVSCSTFSSPSFIPVKATDYFGNYQAHDLFMGQPEKKLLQFDLFPHHCSSPFPPQQHEQHQLQQQLQQLQLQQQYDGANYKVEYGLDPGCQSLQQQLDLVDSLRFGSNDGLNLTEY